MFCAAGRAEHAGQLLGTQRQRRLQRECSQPIGRHCRDERVVSSICTQGGEKKRNEILQLAVLEVRSRHQQACAAQYQGSARPLQADVAILDEIDSGLDIDALREVSQAVNGLKSQANATILVTHYKVSLAGLLVGKFQDVCFMCKQVPDDERGRHTEALFYLQNIAVLQLEAALAPLQEKVE